MNLRPQDIEPDVRAAGRADRARTFSRAATIVAAVAALAGAARIITVERGHQREAGQRLTSGAKRVAASVQSWQQAALARTITLAQGVAITGGPADLAEALSSYARASGDGVRALALFSPEGRLIASTAPTLLVDPTLGQRVAAVQRAGAGTASAAGPFWPSRTRAGSGGEWLFITAAPVRGGDGTVHSVLAVMYDADAPLRSTRQILRQDPMLEAYLVDETGERISSVGGVDAGVTPSIAGAIVPRVSAPSAINTAASGLALSPYDGVLGRPAAGAWVAVAPFAARAVFEIDAAALDTDGGPIGYLFAAALVLAALISVLQAWAFSVQTHKRGAQQAEVNAVVDSAPNAVLIADVHGRITRANAKAAMLLDASVIAIVGSTLDKWLRAGTPLRAERVHSWLESAAREGLARRADGRESPVEVRVGQGEHGGAVLYVVVLLDRTEQQGAAKAAREAKEEATRARERQDELVHAMHSEIRTPMSRVMGMAHLLKDSSLSNVQQGYVESLMRSAQTMMTFVTDVLDLAKMEQGTLQLVEAPFDVRASVEEVGRLCAPQAEANQVRIESRVTERTPAWVIGDAGRVRQVLISLVGNGVKFSGNGRVQFKVDGEPTGRQVRIHVRISDTGPGMDAETTRRLFTKDPTTVSKLAGGGLGLSMAKHLIELMGGRIDVKSLQGEGTTFQFALVFRATEGTANGTAPATAHLAGTRALVVDSSEAEGTVTREWLRSWGMRVETTTTAEEAIGHLRRAAAEGDPVEVALVDRQSLGEQADAFARRLRADSAIAGTGLLISTNAMMSGEAERLALAGCDAVIAKPIGAAALSRSLAAVVQLPRASRGSGNLVSADSPLVNTRRPVEPVGGEIPIVEEPSLPRRVASNTPVDTRLRVLLAEDNRVNQIVATNLLQRLGCRVEVVRDGAEAVKVAARQEYDVIMMDIQMPQLDGLAATGLIRRLPPPHSGPHIIAMGTSASPDERDRYLAAGMNDVVAKPLTPESVQAALERRPAGLERIAV